MRETKPHRGRQESRVDFIQNILPRFAQGQTAPANTEILLSIVEPGRCNFQLLKNNRAWTSLAVQWLRLHLSTDGAWVQPQVRGSKTPGSSMPCSMGKKQKQNEQTKNSANSISSHLSSQIPSLLCPLWVAKAVLIRSPHSTTADSWKEGHHTGYLSLCVSLFKSENKIFSQSTATKFHLGLTDQKYS